MTKRFEMKMLLALLLTMNIVHASLPDVGSLACQAELEVELKKNKSKDEWTRKIDPQKDVYAFVTKTNEFAKWIEIQSFNDPYMFVYTPDKSTIYQWDGRTCKRKILNYTEPLAFLKKTAEGFSDKDLKRMMDKKDSKTLIYMWSPSMIYSLNQMHVFQTVAKKLGMKFLPLLDNNESEEYAKEVLQPYKAVRNIATVKTKSLELFMRDATIHFPMSFVMSNNKISKGLFGAMTPEILEEQIKKALSENARNISTK